MRPITIGILPCHAATLFAVNTALGAFTLDLIVFLVGICVLILGIVFAGWVFFDPRFTADQKF